MSDCIIYQGRITANGYPRRGRVMVHREVLAEKLGRPVLVGMDTCHTCDTRSCINPDHLYEGTRAQNMADCTARGRHNKPRGQGHWAAKLTDDDVRSIRRMHEEGDMQYVIAEMYQVNPATVSRIVRGVWRSEVA